MDTGGHRFRVPQVAGGNDDDEPSLCLQSLTAKDVTLSLMTVALVVPAVVLHHDEPSAQHKVTARDEAPFGIVDGGVALWFGSPDQTIVSLTTVSRGDSAP